MSVYSRRLGHPVRLPESKYHNRKTTVDGMTFDSKKEAVRYKELTLLQKAGMIKCLQRQVVFEIIPSQKEDGKVVERPVKYVADFTYYEGGELVVEDVKSPATRTDAYKIKRKLMRYLLGIRIREV